MGGKWGKGWGGVGWKWGEYGMGLVTSFISVWTTTFSWNKLSQPVKGGGAIVCRVGAKYDDPTMGVLCYLFLGGL